jgi:hypothetical protein
MLLFAAVLVWTYSRAFLTKMINNRVISVLLLVGASLFNTGVQAINSGRYKKMLITETEWPKYVFKTVPQSTETKVECASYCLLESGATNCHGYVLYDKQCRLMNMLQNSNTIGSQTTTITYVNVGKSLQIIFPTRVGLLVS